MVWNTICILLRIRVHRIPQSYTELFYNQVMDIIVSWSYLLIFLDHAEGSIASIGIDIRSMPNISLSKLGADTF